MEKINRCKTCIHKIRKSSGKRTAVYCKQLKSERTRCGYQLIKNNQPACKLYEYGAESGLRKYNVNQLSLSFE